MPISHHSHSGQFCRHARNSLEEMVVAARSKGLKAFALTEHIYRDHIEDLYPEEVSEGLTVGDLAQQFQEYIHEAFRLRAKYASDDFAIPIGFEAEWIRPSSADLVHDVWRQYDVEFFIGSVHHVHSIPIDFDRSMYEQARTKSGGTDTQLCEDYFDSQYNMLRALKPAIVGHFDLIRLFSDQPDQDLMLCEAVRHKISRNLSFMVDYGGTMEINTSAMRKGLAEPYPGSNICRAFKALGGNFTLSDDSHSVDQVGLNYSRALSILQQLGIMELALVQSRTTRMSIALEDF